MYGPSEGPSSRFGRPWQERPVRITITSDSLPQPGAARMTAGAAVLTLSDLERALVAADPAALLVPARILRRVIKKDGGLTGPGLQVPHRKSYVIGREALLAIADRADLGVKPDRELPETVLLFPEPDP